MDNFEGHKSSNVLKKLEQIGIRTKFLPPQTTAGLQPLDLTINHAFKARVRHHYFKWQIRQLDTHALEKIRKITRQEVAQIIFQAWKDIPEAMVRRAWIKSSLVKKEELTHFEDADRHIPDEFIDEEFGGSDDDVEDSDTDSDIE